MARHLGSFGLLAMLASLALGCSVGPSASAIPTTLQPAVTTPQPTPLPTRPPQPTPAHPAPPELIGHWIAEPAPGDVIRLELDEKGFDITRFASANGRIEVFDDEIVFSRSSLCQGEGRYTWTIDGEVLRFTSVTPDECPDRAKSLEGIDFTRRPS